MACDVQKEAAFARGTAGNVFTNNLAIVTSAIQICNLCVSLQFRAFVHYLTSSYCNLSYIPAISIDFFWSEAILNASYTSEKTPFIRKMGCVTYSLLISTSNMIMEKGNHLKTWTREIGRAHV